jgi:hypothetical protein
MAHHKKALVDAFKPHFKEQGFTKRDATWQLLAPDAIHIFNIQTSQWSELYYFNAGVYFRALGPLTTPAEYHCHIRTRIPDDRFHGKSVKLAAELSDFEHVEFDVDKRIVELKNLIYPLAFDWFARFRDAASVKRELSGIGHPWFAVTKNVYPLIGLKLPL